MGTRKILQMKWFPDPLPPAGSYAKQRALITGGTSGLGLATAVHLINLGASEVIITARTTARGEVAKDKIEAQTGTVGQNRVRVLELDMGKYASIVALVERLKENYSSNSGLDFVILSAGTHNHAFVMSAEGREEDIQINALSTSLLGLLLVNWMRQLRPQRASPAHLAFVTSGGHLRVDISKWSTYAAQEGGILGQLGRREAWPGAIAMYNNSKLLAHYGIEEVVKTALGPDGEPLVIVNTLCPGLVKTDLSRSMAASSWLWSLATVMFTTVLSQSPDIGSRLLVEAGLTPPEQNGKFLRKWATDAQYAERSIPNITSSKGREVQQLAWKEMRAELVSRIPSIEAVL